MNATTLTVAGAANQIYAENRAALAWETVHTIMGAGVGVKAAVAVAPEYSGIFHEDQRGNVRYVDSKGRVEVWYWCIKDGSIWFYGVA